MAKTVKTSDGKCWSEGVEVSCPKEKTQTRNMTTKKKIKEKKKDKISEAMDYAKERQRKWGWNK